MVRAPPCHGGGRGFESHPGRFGILAQLGEHLPYKQRVIGSSPIGPINNNNCCLIEYGGIAQLARAHGSYPWCRWFKSSSRYCKRISFMRFFFCDIGKFILSYITKPSGRIRTRVSRSSQQKLTTLGAQSVQAPHE